MYRTRHALTPDDPRRGLILLVVLFMLTLFAIAGISLVLYADAEAHAARLNRDAAIYPQPDMEPEMAFSFFMSQLLYDCLDDETGIYSALRGHSLTRNMWGLDTTYDAARNQWVLNNNYVSYHGAGRLHTAAGSFLNPFNIDDYLLVNYQYWSGDNFSRDPERYGPLRGNPGAPRGPFVGHNVGYTYPDLNSMFLAAARADGTVLMPSFHRPWLFNPGMALNDPANPNWTNQHGKYLILRPRPMDHAIDTTTGQPLFPYPEDATGDVKNWPWAPGGNDSIWIDIDAPVLTAPDGRKYKMLVAPLIVDLDNRINVNVHGNVLGGQRANFDHRSHQGWGPWEVNLGRVLNADADEWKRLVNGRPIAGAATWHGRFGANRLAANGGLLPPLLQTPRPYLPIDFDAHDETTGGPTMPFTLQAAGMASAYNIFPTFPATGYGNASDPERTNHPLWFNPFKDDHYNVDNDDRAFPVSNMAGLLGVRDTGGEAASNCDVIRLLPLNLSNRATPADEALSLRRRRMLTTTSFDLDRPGVIPYVWDPADPATAYRLDPARVPPLPYPTGAAAIPFPDPATQRGNTPPGSEFDPSTWQSIYARLGRLNLDRPLRAYPVLDANGLIADRAGYDGAVSDRQTMAREIYNRLWSVTGAYRPDRYDPAGTPAVPAPTAEQLNALRWLAQLAVNIVDYIDADDYVTPFNWGNVGSPTFQQDYASQWVFGTELPRLVLNEAYVQLDKSPVAGAPATEVQYNVSVELHNPLSASPALTNNGDAVLQIGTTAVYQIVLLRTKDPKLRDPDNVRGEPDATVANQVLPPLTSWGTDPTVTPYSVKPANGQYAATATPRNDGFYVVGPDPAKAYVNGPMPANPMLPSTLTSDSMSYLHTLDAAEPPKPTILLRRLMVPHLPPNSLPGQPDHNAALAVNPYVTVDYLEDVQFNDARTAAAVDDVNWVSYGKNQPFAAHASQQVAQAPAPPATPPANPQPKHTFFRHNAVENAGPPLDTTAGQTLKVPFTWLFHPDRQLVSPVELLHVSGFKPHELTQQFVAPTVADPTMIAPFQHYAPWLTPDSRISRLFGFIENKDRLFDSVQGGRVAGRINLNTVFEKEVFDALFDANSSNGFTQADVDATWQRFLAHRTPGAGLVPGPGDKPLLDVSTGFVAPGGVQFPAGTSVNDTVLGVGAGAGLFYDPASTAHPYLKYEMLNKMYSNVTVRSNVFAVFVTVGFFEVKDPTTKPVKLGAEMNWAERRHIRHRMFAVVDRTNASVFSFRLNPPGHSAPGGGSVEVTFTSNKTPDPLAGDTQGGLRWQLFPGLPLVLNPDNRREETTVINRMTLPNMFHATVYGQHPVPPPPNEPQGDVRMIGRGNVGPWPGFDVRQNAKMVPYWAVIE